MIRVMLCDDMEEIRQYFEWIINAQSDMKVVAMAQSGREAIKISKDVKPDVILMDVQMEEERDGIVATEEISKILPDVKIIMLTIHSNDELLIDSHIAGAVDYLIKETKSDIICDTIRNAYSSKNFVGTIISQKIKEKFKRDKSFEYSAMFFINNMTKMTNAEWRILKLLYNGKKRKEIAKEEVISEETVKFHIRNILKKLNFTSTTEMVAFLKNLGIIEKFNL